METAQIVSEALGAPWHTAEGLHEHDRSNVGWLSKEQLEAGVADFFARPAELVMGRETANQAHTRFSDAVAGGVAQHPDQNVIVVTHGTVVTLYVSRLAGVEPFAFWKRLSLPSFVALSLPDLRLQTVVEDVEVTSGTQVG